MRIAFLFTLGFIMLLAGCRNNDRQPATDVQQEESIPFRIDGNLQFRRDSQELARIGIEVAETDSALERGLMQRPNIPDTVGMLFVFQTEEQQSFWMANTPAPLDLFFIKSDSTIATIAKYTKPFSQEHVLSQVPVRYVVETRAGFADEHGIVEGDRVSWQRTSR